MIRRLFWPCLASTIVIFMACAPKSPAPAPEAKKPVGTVAASEVKTGWEAEWEKVLQEARKEGKLVLYTEVAPEMRRAFTEALKKYGIALEPVVGRGREIAEKILREGKAGLYNADLYMSGLGTAITVLKPAGVFEPLEHLLILPEVRDPKLWYKEQLNFADKEKLILAFTAYLDTGIHANTDIVKPGDIKSMQELLSPGWKGKIIMDDPTVAGRGQRHMSVVAIKLGEDYVRQLAKQEPLLTRDMRMLIDWVAKGRYPVGIGVREDQYADYKRAGAPIVNLLMPETMYLLSGIGNVAYLDKAPHPNATKVFLNWLLSREGQVIWQEIRGDQSARVDISVDHLAKKGQPVRLPGVDYYDTRDEDWTQKVQPPFVKTLQEIYTPLVK